MPDSHLQSQSLIVQSMLWIVRKYLRVTDVDTSTSFMSFLLFNLALGFENLAISLNWQTLALSALPWVMLELSWIMMTSE